MRYDIPLFRRDGSLDGNYISLLQSLGLLDEDLPHITREMAERELSAMMSSFTVNGQHFPVVTGKFKTAAFFWALMKVKGHLEFNLTQADIDAFLDYMTEDIAEEAERHPGRHAALDEVRRTGARTSITINLPDEH